ncbi:sporulation delaying protein family toxin [Staphylococcus pseudintermedius]|nr:sporulation delaying protein family toxin [Staphylococcus pseudintermedius]
MKFKLFSITIIAIYILTTVTMFTDKAEAKTFQYSGEELYRGIIFGQGRVAEKLPEIWTPELREETRNERNEKITNEVVEYVKKHDPSYFKELKEVIEKGNEKEISATLDKGGQLFGKFAESTGIIKRMNDERDSGFRCAVLPVYAVVTFGAAVVVTHAGAVTVALAGVAYKYLATVKHKEKPKQKSSFRSASETEDHLSKYEHEQLIAYIKKQLTA